MKNNVSLVFYSWMDWNNDYLKQYQQSFHESCFVVYKSIRSLNFFSVCAKNENQSLFVLVSQKIVEKIKENMDSNMSLNEFDLSKWFLHHQCHCQSNINCALWINIYVRNKFFEWEAIKFIYFIHYCPFFRVDACRIPSQGTIFHRSAQKPNRYGGRRHSSQVSGWQQARCCSVDP